MIRILHVVSGLGSGGVETMLYNYYSNLDRSQFQFDFIVHDPDFNGKLEKDFRALGCNVYHVTPKKKSLVNNIKETTKVIYEGDYDIVHCHQNLSSFVALLIAKIAKVKIRIAHSHVSYINEETSQKIKNFPYKYLTKLLSTEWFACSKSAALWLFGSKNIEDKVYIINNAVDLEKYRFNEEIRKEIRENNNWENKFVMGNVARFFPEKNHDYLIDIFFEFVQVVPQAVLILIGGEGENSHLKAKVLNLGIADKVFFFGVRNDVHRLMQAMDAFVLPSKFEGFGMVLIESQAAGLNTYTSSVVPQETKITELIKYISIDVDPKIWAQEIIKDKNTDCRDFLSEKLNTSGYEIRRECSKLTKVYQDIYFSKVKPE